jgi:hypothetical protein
MISPRLLYLAAGVFAVAGVALRVAPVELPGPNDAVPAVPAASPSPPASEAAARERYGALVSSNAFAAARTAPTKRWVPEGLRRDTAPPPKAPRKPPEPVARLFGITRGPGGAVALIDADPDVPGAEVYRVGDTVHGGRLSNISESTVTVTRPSGPVVLRLPDSEESR